MLSECRLSHTGIEVLGTPRRLALFVRALQPRQETVTEERRGPPRGRAFGEDGSPTKALLGFCRGCGADAESVFFKEDKKVRRATSGSVAAGLPGVLMEAGSTPLSTVLQLVADACCVITAPRLLA